MNEIRFIVFGLAQPAGSKRAFALRRNGVLTGRVAVSDANPKASDWKNSVRAAAMEHYQGELLTGPLSVEFTFYRPRPKGHFGKRGLNGKGEGTPRPVSKPDVLKLARGVEDSLTAVVWQDDAQIVDEKLAKLWGEPARVEIVIREV